MIATMLNRSGGLLVHNGCSVVCIGCFAFCDGGICLMVLKKTTWRFAYAIITFFFFLLIEKRRKKIKNG